MKQSTRERVVEAYQRLGGNVSATARELDLSRSTIQHHVTKAGLGKKPLAAGTVEGTPTAAWKRPRPGQTRRYLLTSAQNNTRLFEPLWTNLEALRTHYAAELLVGTYTYNQNAYGPLSVKRGTKKGYQRTLWYDDRLTPYIVDRRLALAPGLVWCGEQNILPTSPDPLQGLETYSGQSDAIIPHAKLEMRSVATSKQEPAKFLYTTGSVTLLNYLQKKAGLVAEHHHAFAALVVEVNSDGGWWVRQVQADSKGRIQDLDVVVDGGKVTTGNRVEAVNWGDIHAATIDGKVTVGSLGPEGMLEFLKPRKQFLHDVYEGVGTNHHGAKNCHDKFKAWLRGLDSVPAESKLTAGVIKSYRRKWCETLVVDSNHDSEWLYRWLREHDYRFDPQNAIEFLELQLAVYKALRAGDKKFNVTEAVLKKHGCPDDIRFLLTDESYTICDGRIECGMHGHLGPGGSRGTAQNLAKIGRRSNTGHTHAAGIYSGLYVAGTSSTIDMGYNRGPSAWSHSHIVTYPHGRRAIITMRDGKWRA